MYFSLAAHLDSEKLFEVLHSHKDLVITLLNSTTWASTLEKEVLIPVLNELVVLGRHKEAQK